ncbi:hypothetical protein [Rhizobium leguminosarum]|uniref:hypothetical protein n=1 Tax=Rhizobium leguminosarum TaxID=384 RepID=UPI001C9472F7|nr:hypothetical protein [Rhizobium leguminosarum]MBY5821438.1 hypothetical protein [Rhizobium leguminosarum]
MSDIIRRHVSQFPHARTSTIQYLAKREETTTKLMREILDEQLRRTPRPWWKRLLSVARKDVSK